MAFRFFPSMAASVASRSFQVNTQRHFRMFSSGILLRRILRTVFVSSHWLISFSLVFWNSRISQGVRSLIFTSALWRLAAEATKLGNSFGWLCMCSTSCSVRKISHSKPWSWETCITSSQDRMACPASGTTMKTETPVHGWSLHQAFSGHPHISCSNQTVPVGVVPVVTRVSDKCRMSTGQSVQLLGSKAEKRGLLWIRRILSVWHTQTSSSMRSSASGTGTSSGFNAGLSFVSSCNGVVECTHCPPERQEACTARSPVDSLLPVWHQQQEMIPEASHFQACLHGSCYQVALLESLSDLHIGKLLFPFLLEEVTYWWLPGLYCTDGLLSQKGTEHVQAQLDKHDLKRKSRSHFQIPGLWS